jgi:peptidoglycan/xylan/chitin deacetylase (PgdA/CDA1 family)
VLHVADGWITAATCTCAGAAACAAAKQPAVVSCCPVRAVLQAAALRAVQLGHDIGSHAAQHLDLTKLTAAEIEQQIAWGSGNISTLTGSSFVLVSPQACSVQQNHICG